MPLDIFGKTPIQDSLSPDLQKAVDELKMSASKEGCLQNAYAKLAHKYKGERMATYTRLFEAFEGDASKLWGRGGFMHCTNINYLLRTLLVKSGQFTENDIRLRWTLIYFISPHQYAQVKLNGRWVDIDIWGRSFGIRFGDHAHGLHLI